MATRVVPADVQAILDTEMSESALWFYIELANDHLAETVGTATTTPDASTMANLERLLAAHFATATDPTASQVQEGDARIQYETATGEGLKESRYGRRALDYDPTGMLADANQDSLGPSAMFQTFGADASDW